MRAESEVPESSFSGLSGLSDTESDELTQAIHVIKTLRKENDALRANMRRFKQLHANVLEDVRRKEVENQRLRDEWSLADREYQRLCSSWKAELEDHQRRLDQAQQQLLGERDVEALKMKIADEIDAAYRGTIDGLARDNREQQDKNLRLWKEVQSVRAETEDSVRSALAEAREARSRAERDAADLREERARADQLAKERDELKRRMERLEGERSFFNQERAALKEEALQARARTQGSSLERQAESLDHDRQLSRLRSDVEDLVKQCESSERRRQVAEEGARKLQASHTQLASDLAAAEAARRRAQETADEVRRGADSEKQALESLWASRVATLEDSLREARGELIAQQEAAVARESEFLGKIEASQRQHEQSLRDVNARWQARVADVDKDRSALEARLAAAELSLSDIMRGHREESRELQGRVELLRAENSELKTRAAEAQQNASRAREELARKEGEAEEQRRDYMRAQTEMESTAQRFTDARIRCDALSAENRSLSQRVGQLEAELSEEKRRAETDKASLTTQLDSQRRAWALEKGALVKRTQLQIKSAEERYDAKLAGMRQRLSNLKSTATKYAEERAQLMMSNRELETRAEHAGKAAMQLNPPRSRPSRDYTSPLEEVLEAIQPQLDTIRAKQKEYLRLVSQGAVMSSMA